MNFGAYGTDILIVVTGVLMALGVRVVTRPELDEEPTLRRKIWRALLTMLTPIVVIFGLGFVQAWTGLTSGDIVCRFNEGLVRYFGKEPKCVGSEERRPVPIDSASAGWGIVKDKELVLLARTPNNGELEDQAYQYAFGIGCSAEHPVAVLQEQIVLREREMASSDAPLDARMGLAAGQTIDLALMISDFGSITIPMVVIDSEVLGFASFSSPISGDGTTIEAFTSVRTAMSRLSESQGHVGFVLNGMALLHDVDLEYFGAILARNHDQFECLS